MIVRLTNPTFTWNTVLPIQRVPLNADSGVPGSPFTCTTRCPANTSVSIGTATLNGKRAQWFRMPFTVCRGKRGCQYYKLTRLTLRESFRGPGTSLVAGNA